MRTATVTLARLHEIAANGPRGGTIDIGYDAVRRVAYLRRGQVKYVAPLDDAEAVA